MFLYLEIKMDSKVSFSIPSLYRSWNFKMPFNAHLLTGFRVSISYAERVAFLVPDGPDLVILSVRELIQDYPGENIGLKFIPSQSELFRFIPISVSEPMRIIPNQSEIKFSIQINPNQSDLGLIRIYLDWKLGFG